MSDWFFKQGGRDRIVDWLGIDSKIDSSLASARAWISDTWNAGSSFFARFKLSGWRRLLNEFGSEALSLGTGGLIVVYALALPALVEFDEARFLTGRYSVKFLDINGNEIGKRGILHNDAVPLEEIPDHIIRATLATEDRRFFEHFGIDVLGTARALVENLRANDVVQGGSTLTQQLAKNLFLSSERSLTRKVKELFLAFLLEARFTKREILKLYLDRAYMGGGAFGVEAASQYYFGKSVRNVTLAEAALLAGLYKAPTKYAPHVNLPASRARTNEVLSNLVEAGFYTAGQVHAARLNPARVVENRVANSPDWFLDWAFEEVQRIAEGKGQYVLTARTTIDLGLQKAADEALISSITSSGRSVGARSGAMVTMDVDGAVRAIVGGLDYGESQFNRATAARRQPGSSFKPYVYAVALEEGMTPRTIVRDSSRSCGNWSPKNYSGGGGSGRSLTMKEALARSLNTVAVDLSLRLGREKVLDMVERLGVSGIKRTCSMALGDGGVSVIEHTGGFATFANGGKRSRPYAILDIHNSMNELIYSRERDEPAAPQIVERQVAEQLNQMLWAVVQEGTGRRASLDFTYSVGKTGTSSSYRDAWFVGFTGKYVTGVWVGNDDFRPTRGVTGGSLPAQIWQSLMSVAHSDMNISPIPGLPVHPRQVDEAQRIAELKRSDPTLAAAAAGVRPDQSMPESTRNILNRMARALRKAAGLAPDPVNTAPSQRSDADADPASPRTAGSTSQPALVRTR
ncbi:MAG: PBP1A family penicillin-binding protein [Hyphomicrobiaceae bacterium]|nr:PBP1A family penicillin-binding protein [Hyphomicrobiaceae bacterium]